VTTLDPAAMRPVDRYRLLINGIVPRPIAWVTTVDAAGLVNLAPFSFFNGVTANPPILQVCIAHRVPLKDTLRNLRATGVAVVHLVPGSLLEPMHASSAEYPPEVSEAAVLGLAQQPAERIAGVVLTAAEVAFECRLVQEIPVGDPPTSLCLLEVVLAHVAPSVAQADGLPDPQRLRAVARLGGDSYLLPEAWTSRELPRPRLPR
jgi:flavin reductase (DIM6/NTAB) family NADH-FMN oxidoreductase RutF